MINAELACLGFVFLLFLIQFGSGWSRKPTCCCPWQPDALLWDSSCFSCIFLREVEKFLYRLVRPALCSFSSAAHLVGYYVKEMESIAERWVMLFTGKSDDQRQGITPSRSDVSWKIPLFHREEGKVQRTLEMVGVTTGTLVRKRRRGRRISEQRHSPHQGPWDSKKCQECKKKKKKGIPASRFITWEPIICE